MAEKYVSQTNLTEFWTNIKSKFLEVTGGTVSGNVTVNGTVTATKFSGVAYLESGSTAVTPAPDSDNTTIATTAFVNTLINNKIAAADAMIYKGTLGTSGTITALPDTHKTGWTYKVITAGIYAGQECEIGDLVICLTDGSEPNDAHWTVVQQNIDGAVTGPASATDAHIAVFDGTTGKVIKDSSFTIAKSVPSNAVFTDTHYTTHLIAGASDTDTENAAATNGNVWLNLLDNATIREAHNIVGSGAITVVSDANGKITISGQNTDTKVTNTLNTTAKAYITGTTSDTTNTDTQVFDTGVYLDTTAGMLTATTFNGDLSGNATTATTATKLGSTTVGGVAKPIYLSNGTPTAFSTTIGSATTPVYVNAGTLTAGTYELRKTLTAGANLAYYVKGTQTAATNAWTGGLPDSSITAYYDGLTIDYYLPFEGTSTAATLALGSLGAKPVYNGRGISDTTTHFPAKSVIHLIYVIASDINSGNGAWLASSYYDSTYSNMVGATSSAEGKAGLVPTPPAGADGKYLKGDGTWEAPKGTVASVNNISPDADGNIKIPVDIYAEKDKIGMWKAGEAVAVGARRYLYDRDSTGVILECVQAGTTGTTQPTASVEDATSDGNVMLGLWHAGMYRGKNLGTITSSSIETFITDHAISTGDFIDIFPGDSVVIQDGTYNKTWLVADLDPFYNVGDTAFLNHHVCLIPKTNLLTSYMNETNVTTGGYKGSYMYTDIIPAIVTNLTTVLGDHLLTRRTLISNSVNTSAASGAGAGWTGSSNGWEWVDCQATLATEVQVYGSRVWSSSGYDVGDGCRQLAIFRFKPWVALMDRGWWWLRAVASSSNFCHAGGYGNAATDIASDVGGVRPLICVG